MEFSHTNSGLSIMHNHITYPESQQSTENNSNFNCNGSQYSNIIKNFTEKYNLYINIPSKIIESAKLNRSNNSNSNSNFKKTYDYLKLDVNQKRKSQLFSQNTYTNSELSTPISLQAEDFVSDYQVLLKVSHKKQSLFSKTQIQSPLQKYKVYFWQLPNAEIEDPIVLNLEIADDIVVEKALKKIIKAFNKFLSEEQPTLGFKLNNSTTNYLQNFEILPAKKNGKPKEDMPSLDNEQLLSMSGLQNIVLVIKDLQQGIFSEKEEKNCQPQVTISNQKRINTDVRPAETSVIVEEKSINMIVDSYSQNEFLNSKADQQNKKKQSLISQHSKAIANKVNEPAETENFCCKLFSFKNIFKFSSSSATATKKNKSKITTTNNNTICSNTNFQQKLHKATNTTNFSSFRK